MNKEELKATKGFVTATTKLVSALRRQVIAGGKPEGSKGRVQAADTVTKAEEAFGLAEAALQPFTSAKPAPAAAAPAAAATAAPTAKAPKTGKAAKAAKAA